MGAQEDQSVAPTRYSLQSGDMPLLRDNLLKQKDRYEKGRGETAFVINRDDNGKSTESNMNGNNRNIEKDGAYWRPSNKKQRSSLQDTDNGEITEGTFGDRRGSEHLGSASRGGLLASTRYQGTSDFRGAFFILPYNDIADVRRAVMGLNGDYNEQIGNTIRFASGSTWHISYTTNIIFQVAHHKVSQQSKPTPPQ